MKIYNCIPLTPELKRYYGDEMHLRESHALKLQREKKIKIIGLHDELSNVNGINKSSIMNKTKTQQTVKYILVLPSKNHVDIPVLIPYAPNGMIGAAYNNVMKLIEDWVLFIDHDILLGLNPYWYEICNNAISAIGHNAGWLTCYTNRIGCSLQKAPDVNTISDDIRYHQMYARNLYKLNKGKLTDVTNIPGKKFSGMFILTHKKAWSDAKGFPENIGFFGVDCEYYTRLKQAGYKTLIMKDLYVYHSYFREVLKPVFKTKGEILCPKETVSSNLG